MAQMSPPCWTGSWPDDVAVVGGRVQLRRVLAGVVDRVAPGEPAGAAGGGEVRRHVGAGRLAVARGGAVGAGAGRAAAERHGRGVRRARTAEAPRGVALGADGEHLAGVVEVVGQVRVAGRLLQRRHLVTPEVAGDVEAAGGAEQAGHVAVALGGPAHVLGRRARRDHVVGHDRDRPGVAEVALGRVDAVLHQRLHVAHAVGVDDLLAEGVDDDHHDLRRPFGRSRSVSPVSPVSAVPPVSAVSPATPGLGTRLGPDDGERDRRGGNDGEQAGTVLSHDDSLPARRRCRDP